MNYNLIVLPDASEDILNCALWYLENHDPSGAISDAFIEAIEHTMERLKISPEYHSIRHDDVRGIQVKRNAPKGQPRNFPHIIFYRFQTPDIVVIQVFPMKDDPSKVR